MDIIGILTGVLTNHIGGVAGAVGGLILAPFAWKVVAWCYDYFKPMQEFTEFAKDKAYQVGLRQRAFMDKRIKDDKLKMEIIDDIDKCQDEIHTEYMRGLRG